MNFKQIDIYTNSPALQVLMVKLTELGVTGFIIHDSSDFDEFISNKNDNWDYIDDDLMKLKETPTFVTFYLPDDSQGIEILRAITGLLELLRENELDFYGSLDMMINSVKEEDWENCWKEYYKPFQIGKKFIIKPTWENVEAKDNMLILEIDPASTFGTGQHNTTQLCIELLEDNVKSGDNVLDLGCGSGILSIAALLLGAENATIVDIFENAVKTASENIIQNNFDKSRFKSFCGNVIEDLKLREKIGTGYDIITANIVADVIIPMSGFLKSFVKEDGKIIISGIIANRLPDVKSALEENGIKIIEIKEKEDWVALLCE